VLAHPTGDPSGKSRRNPHASHLDTPGARWYSALTLGFGHPEPGQTRQADAGDLQARASFPRWTENGFVKTD